MAIANLKISAVAELSHKDALWEVAEEKIEKQAWAELHAKAREHAAKKPPAQKEVEEEKDRIIEQRHQEKTQTETQLRKEALAVLKAGYRARAVTWRLPD